MIGWQVKAIAAAVVLIALGALAWRINAWRNGYLERDQAVAERDAERKARRDDMKEVITRLEKSDKDRQQFIERFDAIDKRFDGLKIPPPAELAKSTEVPGEPCPRVGVSDSFVSVFNDASAPVDP